MAVSQVEAFLKENNIKTWNGGWLPSRNSRGEKVREVPCFGDFKSYDEWFNTQGVEIIDLTK